MINKAKQPQRNSSRRESGKNGLQQRNKDKLGANSGPMGKEDQRKDKFGSTHNQDAQGLESAATGEVRAEMHEARRKLAEKKRHRRGSRGG